jgi:hypothetical protein
VHKNVLEKVKEQSKPDVGESRIDVGSEGDIQETAALRVLE